MLKWWKLTRVWKTRWPDEIVRLAKWLWCSRWASTQLKSMMIKAAWMVNQLTRLKNSWTPSITSFIALVLAFKLSWRNLKITNGSSSSRKTLRRWIRCIARCGNGKLPQRHLLAQRWTLRSSELPSMVKNLSPSPDVQAKAVAIWAVVIKTTQLGIWRAFLSLETAHRDRCLVRGVGTRQLIKVWTLVTIDLSIISLSFHEEESPRAPFWEVMVAQWEVMLGYLNKDLPQFRTLRQIS